MLSQQIRRRIIRSSVVWSYSTNDVCIFCRTACAPNASRRTYAKGSAPKAPSTRDRLWREKARVMSAREKEVYADPRLVGGKMLPPFELILGLNKAGLIKADPQSVLNLLDVMRELGTRVDGPKAKQLCDEHGVALEDMPYIARACLYSRNFQPVQKLGKRILLAMSANDVPQATLLLLRAAIRQDEGVSSLRKAFDSPELAYARRHLRKLLEDKHPEALVLQAKRLAKAGKRREAIVTLRDAIESGAANQPPDGEDAEGMHKKYSGVFLQDVENTKSESPWTLLAQLERDEGNFEGAAKAFYAGAFEHDDPMAYQGLAGTVDEYSRIWLEYMTKAAASGSWTAMRRLGSFYSVELEKIPDDDLRAEMKHLEEHNRKIEWYYYYLSDFELENIDIPPDTELIGSDFWRPYNDPDNVPSLRVVLLNRRHAMAMEWYEVAWRAQFIFSESEDIGINIAMQKLVEKAAVDHGPEEEKAEEEDSWSKLTRSRHRDIHRGTRESMQFERTLVEFNELKNAISNQLSKWLRR